MTSLTRWLTLSKADSSVFYADPSDSTEILHARTRRKQATNFAPLDTLLFLAQEARVHHTIIQRNPANTPTPNSYDS